MEKVLLTQKTKMQVQELQFDLEGIEFPPSPPHCGLGCMFNDTYFQGNMYRIAALSMFGWKERKKLRKKGRKEGTNERTNEQTNELPVPKLVLPTIVPGKFFPLGYFSSLDMF